MEKLSNMFLECSNFSKDPEWKNIFLSCSQGNYPYGMFIKNNKLIIRKDGKNFSCRVPIDSSIDECYAFFVSIFKEKMNMYSIQEHTRKWDSYFNIVGESTKKECKIDLFIDYVSSLDHLNSDVKKQVFNDLVFLYSSDFIQYNDLVFGEDQEIIDISNINISEDGTISCV